MNSLLKIDNTLLERDILRSVAKDIWNNPEKSKRQDTMARVGRAQLGGRANNQCTAEFSASFLLLCSNYVILTVSTMVKPSIRFLRLRCTWKMTIWQIYYFHAVYCFLKECVPTRPKWKLSTQKVPQHRDCVKLRIRPRTFAVSTSVDAPAPLHHESVFEYLSCNVSRVLKISRFLLIISVRLSFRLPSFCSVQTL